MNEQSLEPISDPIEMDPAQVEPTVLPEPKSKSRRKSKEHPSTDPGAEQATSAPNPVEKQEVALEASVQTDPEPDRTAPDDSPADESDPEELGRLHQELTRLREEVRSARQTLFRQEAELEEFRSLWPNVSLSTLPDSVLQDVERGVPLTAAYALMEKSNSKPQNWRRRPTP